MTPRRYGPLAYVPITRRPKLTWPGGARVALWVNPNIEFFGLDDVMPGNLNERVPREHARIPNVRNWAVRDYGNRVGIWRIMEVLPLWHSRQRGAQQRGVRPSSGDHRGGRPARLGADRP
jgi:allantoinase